MIAPTDPATESKPWRISLCDECRPSAFGKLDLIGYNHSDTISIDESGYIFTSTIVAEGPLVPEFLGEEVSIQFGTQEANMRAELISPVVVGRVTPYEKDARRLLIVVPFQHALPGPSRFLVSIFIGSAIVSNAAFDVELGTAPNVRVGDRLPGSGLLGVGPTSFDILTVVKRASRELLLADQYLAHAKLSDLLVHVDRGVDVRVLTSPQQAAKYHGQIDALRQHGHHISVRSSRTFHDRFVIVNRAEVYHFGHSLDALSKGRASRYARVTARDEVDQILAALDADWNAAIAP
jgi:hypothetical protein